MIIFLSFLPIFVSQESQNCSKTYHHDIFAQETLQTVFNSEGILETSLRKFTFKLVFSQNISLANLDLIGQVYVTISQFYSQNFSQISILTKQSDSIYFISKFKNEQFILKNNNFEFEKSIIILQRIQLLDFTCTNMQQTTKYYIVTKCYSDQFYNFLVLDAQNNLKYIYINKNISDQQIVFTQFDKKLYFIFQDSKIRKIFFMNLNENEKELYYYNIEEIEIFFDLNETDFLNNYDIDKFLDITLTDKNYLLISVSTNLNQEFQIKFDLYLKKQNFQIPENFQIDYQKQLKGTEIQETNLSLQYNYSSDFIFNFQAKTFQYLIFQQNRVIHQDGYQDSIVLADDLNLILNYNVQRLYFIPNGFLILNSTNLIYLTIQEQYQLPVFQQNDQQLVKTFVLQQKKLCFQFKLISELQNTLRNIQFGILEITKIKSAENEKNTISLDIYSQNFSGYPFEIESVEIENNKYNYEHQNELSCPALGNSLNNSILVIAKLQSNIPVYFVFLENKNQLVIKFCEHFITKKIKLQEEIKREQICSTSNFVYAFMKTNVIQISITNLTIEYQKINFQDQIIFLNCLQSQVILQLQNFSLYKIELFQKVEKLQMRIKEKVQSIEISNNKFYIIVKHKLYIYQNNKVIEEFDEYKYHSIHQLFQTSSFMLFSYDEKNQNFCLINYKQTSLNFRRVKILPMYNFTVNSDFQIAVYARLVLINMKDNQFDPFIFIYDTIQTGPNCLIRIIKLEQPIYAQFFGSNQIIFQNKNKLIVQNIFEKAIQLKNISLKTPLYQYVNVNIVLKQHFYTNSIRKKEFQQFFYASDEDDELKQVYQEPVKFELKQTEMKSIQSSSLMVDGSIYNLTLQASNCASLYNPIQITNQTFTRQPQLLLLEICKHYLVYRKDLITKIYHIFDLLTQKWYNISTSVLYFIETTSCSYSEDFIFAVLLNQESFKQELYIISNLTTNKPVFKLISINLQEPYEIKLMNQIVNIIHLTTQFYYYDFKSNQLFEIVNLQLDEISTQFFLEDNPDFIIFLIRKQNKLFLKLILLDRDKHQFSTRNLEVAFENIFYVKNCFNHFQGISGFINKNEQFELLTLFNCNGFYILANIIVSKSFLNYEIIIKHNLRLIDIQNQNDQNIVLATKKFIVLRNFNRLFWYWIDNQQQLNINCYYSESLQNQKFKQLKDTQFYVYEKSYHINKINLVNIGQYSIGLKQDHEYCETKIRVSYGLNSLDIPIILKKSALNSEKLNYILFYCLTIASLLLLIYMIQWLRRRRKLKKFKQQIKIEIEKIVELGLTHD